MMKLVKWGIAIVAVLVFVGFRWGLTPLPNPPKGVRLAPIRPPFTSSDVVTETATDCYLRAIELAGQSAMSSESKEQMESILNADWPSDTNTIMQVLAEHEDALQLVRRGAGLGRGQMPFFSSTDPHMKETALMRMLGRLLCCAGEISRRENRPELACDDFLAVVSFGRDCANGGPVISMLVGNSIVGAGDKALRRLMLSGELPVERQKSVARVLLQVDEEFTPLGETFRYELISCKQMTGTIFTNGIFSSLPISKGTLHRMADAAFGDLIQEAEKPFWQNNFHLIVERWESERITWLSMLNRPVPRLLIGMLVSGLEKVPTKAAERSVDLRATSIVCALQAYQRSQGQYPSELVELVPEFLPLLPIDPFVGQPMRYRRASEGWVVWSVGSDMKDDDAAWHEFKYQDRNTPRAGGDIYFKSTEPQDDLEWRRTHPKSR